MSIFIQRGVGNFKHFQFYVISTEMVFIGISNIASRGEIPKIKIFSPSPRKFKKPI